MCTCINDRITYPQHNEVYLVMKFTGFDFASIDTDLQRDNELPLIRILEKYSEFFVDDIPTRPRIDIIDPNISVQSSKSSS